MHLSVPLYVSFYLPIYLSIFLPPYESTSFLSTSLCRIIFFLLKHSSLLQYVSLYTSFFSTSFYAMCIPVSASIYLSHTYFLLLLFELSYLALSLFPNKHLYCIYIIPVCNSNLSCKFATAASVFCSITNVVVTPY